jgi:hypothetical protein
MDSGRIKLIEGRKYLSARKRKLIPQFLQPSATAKKSIFQEISVINMTLFLTFIQSRFRGN